MGENKEPVNPGSATEAVADEEKNAGEPVTNEGEKTAGPPVKYKFHVEMRTVECVGPYFLRYYREKNAIQQHHRRESEQVVEEQFEIDNDDTYLKSLDPKLWKNQDHYAVLGLKAIRHRASEALIRKAYKQKVLLHHPDKRANAGKIDINNDYFTCITKAWEILGSKEKRRAFDSVDPEFENTIPYDNESVRKHFFEEFGPVFERNSRWSIKKNVPKLGGPDATKEEVEKFYNFWFNFESWREFSYWDSEAKESGQDRDERKWIEKQNKADRAKKKKDEMARLRRLVELAYNLDPRIVQFKNDEKERKLAMKKAKQDAAREKAEELKRIEREAEEKARREKEEEEAKEKAKAEALKAEREAEKRIIKKERKKIRDICKANNYFISNDDQLVEHMTAIEKALAVYTKTELIELSKSLEENGKDGFMQMIASVEKQSQEERKQDENLINKQNTSQSNDSKGTSCWSKEDVQILIRAVNLFPAGTVQRWEAVTNFINQHNSGLPGVKVVRNKKEVLSKVKELQSTAGEQLKETINKNAYESFEKEKKATLAVSSEASERVDVAAVASTPWTAEEQKLLEQALKSFPSGTPERWDRISECVKSRSKKECMLRCKELAEVVKAKKAAQASKGTGK